MSNPIKVLVSGPMTGIEGWNYDAFNAAALWLRQNGHHVWNPAESYDGDTERPREDYLKVSLDDAIQCDRIALLDGWEKSRGAILELLVAFATGSEVWRIGGGERMGTETSRLFLAKAHDIEQGLRRLFDEKSGELPGLVADWITPDGTPADDSVTDFFEALDRGDLDPKVDFSDAKIDWSVKAEDAEFGRDHFAEEIDAIKALQSAKRSDYTAGSADPLANYRFSAAMVNLGVTEFMFGRMAEKMYRLKSIFAKGGDVQVADETIADTFRDIAIIALLCKLSLTPGTPHYEAAA